MDVRIYESGGNVLIQLQGRVVLEECDRLKSSILPFINPSISTMSLDLSKVEFIDSAGLGALVGIKISANKHKARLALLNPSRGVSDILMVSKLDSIFDLVTGQDAETTIQQLEKPENEKSASGDGGGSSDKGPSMPSMPQSAQQSGAASEDDPKKAELDRLCRSAVEHMKRGDFEKAAETYIEALDLEPTYLPANNNLAIVYEKKPHWHAKAIEQWKKVLDLSTKNNDQKHIDRAQKHLNNLEQLGS